MQDTLLAGDTLNYRADIAGYSAADGWALRLRLVPRSSAAASIEVTATQDGDDWLVRVPAATTAGWSAGDYSWVAWVEKSSESYTIETGQINVQPNLRTMVAADTRSHARRTLDAVEAVIEGRASSAVAEYAIGGRSLKNTPVADLLVLRDKYRADVLREDAAARSAAGLAPRGRMMVRFGR